MSIRNAWLSAAILAAIAGPASAEQTITKRATVAPDATVEISNVQGSVEVTAWDRNEIELVAELESSKDELEFEATEKHVRIEVDRPHGHYDHDDEDDANLTLHVPQGARLIIDTVSADITIVGVKGEQSLESVSGTVETQAFDSPLKLSSVSGEVIATGHGGKAEVSTENVSGTTTVTYGVSTNYSMPEPPAGNVSRCVVSSRAPCSPRRWSVCSPSTRRTLNSVSESIDLQIYLRALDVRDRRHGSRSIKRVRISQQLHGFPRSFSRLHRGGLAIIPHPRQRPWTQGGQR